MITHTKPLKSRANGVTELNPQKLIAFVDNSGILQVNNVNSGNLLMSLTNQTNKLLVSRICFVNVGRVYIAAGCIDGTIVFFFRPIVDSTKENQTPQSMEQSLVKRGVHEADITCISFNTEYVAFGGHDNKISVWKILGAQRVQTIQLPGVAYSTQPDNVDLRAVTDFKFITIKKKDGSKWISVPHILVLQNTGHVHLCQPRQSTPIAENIIDSGCLDGLFDVS